MGRREASSTGGRLTNLSCSVLVEEMLSRSPHEASSPVPSEALVSLPGKAVAVDTPQATSLAGHPFNLPGPQLGGEERPGPS